MGGRAGDSCCTGRLLPTAATRHSFLFLSRTAGLERRSYLSLDELYVLFIAVHVSYSTVPGDALL